MERGRMSDAHILVVADSEKHADHLANHLLKYAGYKATVAKDDTPPPGDVDVVLVDVDRVLVSPLVGLKAQRRLGCSAPALLVAPRLNEAMAAQVFVLNIRNFLTKPAKDEELVEKIKDVLRLTELERGQKEMGERLRRQDEILKRRLDELDTMSRVGRVLTVVEDVDTVLSRIVDGVVYLTRADEGALFMADEQGSLNLRAEKNLGQREASTLSTLSNDSTAAGVFQTGKPVMRVGEAAGETFKVKTGYLVQALINVPIIIGTKVVGVMAVYNHGNKPFEENDLKVMIALSDYAAVALDKAQRVEALQQRVQEASEDTRKVFAHTDNLTSPSEAVDAQLKLLLSKKLGDLTQKQMDALKRIRLSMVRIKEINDSVRAIAETYQPEKRAKGK
jgi:two-component system NtrC family sensor kinase